MNRDVEPGLREGGRPLPSSERSWLERTFGRDLSDVRLHDDEAADTTARAYGAGALAQGSTVVLGTPARRSALHRRAVLAHEVAHVVQQSGSGSASAPALERDANLAAGAAVLGAQRSAPQLRGGLRLQGCVQAESMSAAELDEYIAQNHFRIVVTQETHRFLTGMKKSVAVAANPQSNITDPVKRSDDQLITAGRDYPRLRDVLVEMPSTGERWTRPSREHEPTGTFTVHLMFPGRYDITANVLFAPGRVQSFRRSIEVERADFVRESDVVAAEHLASQEAATPERERVGWLLQRAELRQRAVTAGLLDQRVADAWTDLSFAVVARAAALAGQGLEAGTATAVDDAVGAFAAAFGEVPAELQLPISILRARARTSDTSRLRSSMDQLSGAFDGWVLAQLKSREAGKELATAFEHGMQVERAVADITRRAAGGAVKVPAVFHPEAAYVRRELLVPPPHSTGRIMPVPLNLWIFSEGGDDWTLRDVSNPKEAFEYDTSGPDRAAALDNLLQQLAHDEERFLTGRLHVMRPERGAKAYAVEGDMDIEDWFAVAALILAAAGIIMVTAGTATPAVVAAGGYLLTTSAVVGAGLAIADTIDAYERGRLTEKRLALNALQVVASVATAGTSSIFTSAARQGSLALLGTNARYIMLNRVAASTDIATLLVMTGDTAIRLTSMGSDGRRDDQAALRAALAIGQLLVQGTMTVVSARDAFHGDLRSHPHVELHEAADGTIVVRNTGAAAQAADPTAVAGPRVAEDLLAPGGRQFSTDHQPLRDAYERYLQRCRAEQETPLEPLDWLKFQTSGPAATYLDQALPAGWRAARRGQYPGSRPHLIDRPSNAPPEGSLDPTTGRRWRHRSISIDEIRPEVDAVGDPYWTFPDLVDGEVLILPSGTRVWKDPPTGAIVEEHPVSASVTSHRTRTAGESTVMDRADMGPAHQAALTERAHGAGSPGLGFDSPYGVAHAPRQVNQILENKGIEQYMRRLRDNTPPGVQYLFTTRTYRSGQNLTKRVYDIDAIHDGVIHPMFQFKIVVEGSPPNLSARLVDDETSVFIGADAYGSPKMREQPAGAPPGGEVGVDIPGVLQTAMGRTSRRAVGAVAPLEPAIEQIQRMRPRLDDLLESRIRSGQLDQRWMDAHDRALRALDGADERLRTTVVCTSDTEELRRMLTELAQRAGRHPHTVDARRLDDFARRVDRLELD